MRRIVQAAFYSGLFTMYGGSFYYVYALLMALSSGGSVVQAFVDTLIACIVCWLFGTFVFYEIGKMFDEFNKSGRRRPDDHDKEQQDKDKDC